jgi:drug/metabolite transporter (DMT)-like permease
MQTSTKANLYLVLVTAIWGLTFPLIRNAVAHIGPLAFVCVRFAIAALTLLPLVWRSLNKTTLNILFCSLVLGLLNSGSYITQTIGLQTISSARAAFITGVGVIIVPFLMPLFRLGKPTILEIACSAICFLGLYILTGAHFTQISTGDKWVLLCALCWALSLSFLQRISVQIKEYKLLTFYPILFTGPFAYIFSGEIHYRSLLYPSVIIGILFCAIMATSVAIFLQTKYQKFTTASKAALIFTLEPLFASIFGYIVNGEGITHNTFVGGILILFSLMLPELLKLWKK